MVDDISNTTRGYSFLSEEPFASSKHTCFLHVVKTKRLTMLDSNGRLVWNKPATKQWLLTESKYWRIIRWLLTFTGRISTRLAQEMENTMCNDDNLRSLIIQCGEMLNMGRNHKTGHILEQDAFDPAFVPSTLAGYIVQGLAGGIRETAAIMIHHEVGAEGAEIHRT